MGCCGEKLGAVIEKGANIAVGYGSLAAGIKYEFTDDRIRACHACEMQTWMMKLEYEAWLKAQGIINIVANFTELEKLPMLPKFDQDNNRRNLFCRVCKCYVPAKSRVEKERCPLSKWDSNGF